MLWTSLSTLLEMSNLRFEGIYTFLVKATKNWNPVVLIQSPHTCSLCYSPRTRWGNKVTWVTCRGSTWPLWEVFCMFSCPFQLKVQAEAKSPSRHLPGVRHWARCFVSTVSINSCNDPQRGELTKPLFLWEVTSERTRALFLIRSLASYPHV